MKTEGIAKEFDFKELLQFSFPSIIMMIFMSLYTIVDGFFVSRFVGPEALSAVNIVYPSQSAILAVCIMFSTGGSAIVALQMGEGKPKLAKQNYTFLVCVTLFIVLLISVFSLVNMESVVRFLGASGALIPLSKTYLSILIVFAPVSALQILFQNFFVTAGRPNLGLGLTVAGGLFNMIFDYVLIVPCGMGIAGAAYATAASYCIPAVGGLWFFFHNKQGLSFTKPVCHWNVLWKSCINGSSEMVTNLSGSVTTFLFNILMMKYVGAEGVAAVTAVLYSQFLMTSLFLGFSIGVAPIISYHYGADNLSYLKKTIKRCAIFIGVVSCLVFGFAYISAPIISAVFFHTGSLVHEMAAHGLRIFSVAFLFAGVNIFGSALFTALGNGKVSAIISFSRTFLFTIVGILGMSYLWGVSGLWCAVPFAELITVFVVCYFIKEIRKILRR
ncbi:MAG: MATE family efflux transporter [Lachnospiraceae bacterium]